MSDINMDLFWEGASLGGYIQSIPYEAVNAKFQFEEI